MSVEPKKHLVRVDRLSGPYIDRQKYVRLDKNEATTPFEVKVLDELKNQLDSYILSAYPEPEPLYKKLSDHLNIDRSELFLTSGSDLAIKTVFEVFVSEGDKVLTHEPSYAMSSVYCSLFNAEKLSMPFNKSLTIDIDQFCDRITKDIKLVIFENPNGFVGTGFSLSEIKKLIIKARENDTLILVDEAYFPFHNITAIDLINDYGNLIISRTFSKSMSLAGVRLGYLVSNRTLMSSLIKFRPMHEISSLAIVIGCYFLDHIAVMDQLVCNVRDIMKSTIATLKQNNIEAFGTDANFILIRLPEDISRDVFQDSMRARGILVRRPFDQGILKNLVRVGLGSEAQMDDLIGSLQWFLCNR
jgi:histidinol-phosphate aminotransferase